MEQPPKRARTQEQTTTTSNGMEKLRNSILNLIDASLSLAGHVISGRARESNFVFSPLSIHVLLGLIASGSDGPTRDQILGFLSFESLEELSTWFSRSMRKVLADGGQLGGPVLSTANGIWVDQSLTLKPSYRDTVENNYGGFAEQVDFQNKASDVTEEVNAWAKKETNGLIEEIIPPGVVNPSLTKLILANAVYFKGAWVRKFRPSLTEEREFYLLDGSSVRAPFMKSHDHQIVKFFDGFKVLRMPYQRGGDWRIFSMYIYLPDAVDGLPELRERVCSESGFIDTHLPSYQQRLDDFRVPKFKFDFGFEASDALKELGVVLPFDGGELTEMVEPGYDYPLEVSSMFQKSLIEVNEEGTEATAVFASLIGGGGGERKRFEFVADHPFMFVIREDKIGLILFIGQLLNPLSPAA